MSQEPQPRDSRVIIKSFNDTINNLIKMLTLKSKTELQKANLDRLKKRLNLLRQIHVDFSLFIITNAGPYIHQYSEQILKREESFFLSMDARQLHSHEIEKEDEFVFDLIDGIKDMYRQCIKKEQDQIYTEVLALHTDFVEYCMVTGFVPKKRVVDQNE